MEKLGIPAGQLKPTKLTFHDIVPGLSCMPMGRIQLEVLFIEKENFRHEPIWFEVVDLNSLYHALLGCPTLAKFMAIPHYANLKMKLPGPHRVITIMGCYKKSMECVKASSKLAEALVVTEEKCQLLQQVALTQSRLPALSQPASNLKPTNDAKKILPEVDKMARVIASEAGLSAK
jgi:hypothetical protein